MGRRIVVTGGGAGLGRAFARRLASEGHTPILLGRRLDKVQAVAGEVGGEAFALACDVADPASVNAAFAEVARRCGAIDGLINNAATFQPFFVKDATDEQIQASLDTNIAGAVHCARAAIPLMGKGGIIINVGSETVESRVAMFSMYQASKAGLRRFTTALQQELAPAGIRVIFFRAGKMVDEDYTWNVAPETARVFMEENLKRGIDQRSQPMSSFNSVAAQLGWLLKLPADVEVTEVLLEGRFA